VATTAGHLVGGGGLTAQAAQIGPHDYVVTVWDEGATDGVDRLDATLDDVMRLEPSALVLDVRAVEILERATVDAFAGCMGRLRDAGVAAVLVANWHELTRGVGAEGLDRFVAIRPTLASAIDAIRGQSA
jgi:anti-anti-sigma regulatory factor